MRAAGLLPLALLIACGDKGGDEAAGNPALRSEYRLEPVVGAALEALAIEPEAALPEPEPDQVEAALGLCTFYASSTGDLREVALEEARDLGTVAIGPLAGHLNDASAPDEERAAAIVLLGTIGGAFAAEELLGVLEDPHTSPWMRSNAAYQLGRMEQRWVLPRLVLRLKYEKDRDTFVWLVEALARHGNFSGAAPLLRLWQAEPDGELKQLAAAKLSELASIAGFDSSADVVAAWARGPHWEGAPLPRHDSTPRLEHEIWKRVAMLAEFQLRGVDDSRELLSNMGTTAAGLVARALRDESRYIRLHAAQVLERMGPRASVAGPALIEALDEPEIAAQAATALGRMELAPALEHLTARLAPEQPLGLRIAAARALGYLQLEAAAEALRPHVEADRPTELRQAAAESLAYLGFDEEVLGTLVAFADDPALDPVSSESAIRWALARRAEEQDVDAAAALEDWDAVRAAPEGVIATSAQRSAARAKRLDIVRALLAD